MWGRGRARDACGLGRSTVGGEGGRGERGSVRSGQHFLWRMPLGLATGSVAGMVTATVFGRLVQSGVAVVCRPAGPADATGGPVGTSAGLCPAHGAFLSVLLASAAHIGRAVCRILLLAVVVSGLSHSLPCKRCRGGPGANKGKTVGAGWGDVVVVDVFVAPAQDIQQSGAQRRPCSVALGRSIPCLF